MFNNSYICSTFCVAWGLIFCSAPCLGQAKVSPSGAVYGDYISPQKKQNSDLGTAFSGITPIYGQILDPRMFDSNSNPKINTVTIVRPGSVSVDETPDVTEKKNQTVVTKPLAQVVIGNTVNVTNNSSLLTSFSDPLRQSPPPAIQEEQVTQANPTTPGTVNPNPLRQSPPPDTAPPIVPPPEIAPAQDPALPDISLEEKRALIDLKIKNALSNTALNYPFILNPTDRITFSSNAFRPLDKDYYFEFDVKSGAGGDPNIGKVTTSFFPKNDQFYWVLPENKIVFETTGYQLGLIYQGRSRNLRLDTRFRQIQSYNGLQFVTVIPADLEKLKLNPGNTNTTSLTSILSVVGQIRNPEGTSAPNITTNITDNLENVRVVDANSIQFPLSGGELFSQLAVDEPVLLQGFPTIDLRPLANTDLREGGRVTAAELAEAGITFGNVLTGKPPEITAPVSSLPGIKVGQLGKFDNTDLLKVLLDRSLSPSKRRFHYLNSLQWVSLGIRVDNSELSEIIRGNAPKQDISTEASQDWYRFYFSLPYQRSSIQYDPKETVATFTQVFSNPGISASINAQTNSIDNKEAVNSTVGLLAGGLFRLFNPNDVNGALSDAKDRREKNEDFSPLVTEATTEQRRIMNRRVNTALAYSNFTSRIEQFSGRLTLPSKVSPDSFSALQFSTGLSRRGIGFSFQSEPTFSEGDIFYRTVRLSDDNFGLGFSNSLIPTAINDSLVAETLFTSSTGEQVLFRAGTDAITPVPIPTRAAAIAFDRLEIQRDAIRTDRVNLFNGFQLLPTTELNFSGSSNGFNYSFSSGAWFNFNNSAIFNVPQNTTGISEPNFGFYLNALLNLTEVSTRKNEEGNIIEISSSAPGINLRYNTAANSLNPSFVSVNYSFTRNTPETNLFITPSVSFVSSDQDQGTFLNGSLTTSLSSSLQLRSLQFSGSIEFGNNTFYQLEGFNNFNYSWGAGLFYRNFTDFLAGSGRREQGTNVGVRVRYSFDSSPFGLDVSIGSGASGWESRFQGTLRF